MIGTLTSYHSAADPTDVQAGVFKVIVSGQVTHPAEITVDQQRGRPGQRGGQLVPARRLLTSPPRPGGLDRRCCARRQECMVMVNFWVACWPR